MQHLPYYNLMDQICRHNSWVLGQDAGIMVLGIPAQSGDNVSVVVEEFQDQHGLLSLRLWAHVANKDQFPADQALAINAQLPHGAMAEKEGRVIMVVTRTLNQTNQAELTSLLGTISYYADFYGKHYGAQGG